MVTAFTVSLWQPLVTALTVFFCVSNFSDSIHCLSETATFMTDIHFFYDSHFSDSIHCLSEIATLMTDIHFSMTATLVTAFTVFTFISETATLVTTFHCLSVSATLLTALTFFFLWTAFNACLSTELTTFTLLICDTDSTHVLSLMS